MKYIVAVIQPDKLDAVLDALERRDINLVTVSAVMGRGRQKGVAEIYRGHKEGGRLLRKTKLEIAVNDAFLEPALAAITESACTEQTGDGKIFVMDLDECVRIRTRERGHAAIG